MKTVRQMSAFQLAFFAVFTVTIMMATTIVAQRSTAITYQLPHKQPKIQWENLDKQNFSVPLDHFSPLNAQHGNFVSKALNTFSIRKPKQQRQIHTHTTHSTICRHMFNNWIVIVQMGQYSFI